MLRLPILTAGAYLLRDRLIAAVDHVVTLEKLPGEWVIGLLSTPFTRMGWVILLAGSLILVLHFSRHSGPVKAYAATLAFAAMVIPISFHLTGTRLTLAVPALLLLAANLLPPELYQLGHRFMMWGAGVAEVLFSRQFVDWVSAPIRPRRGLAQAIPGALVASIAAACLMPGPPLTPIEQYLRNPSAVRMFAPGDFNWIETSPDGRFLYAAGHGLPQLRRYDLGNLSAPPLESDASTGGAQAFAYDRTGNELFVVNESTQSLLYLDSDTLRLKRSVSLPRLAIGDVMIAFDRSADTIAIASEADQRGGVSFLLVDRASGAIRDQRSDAICNLLAHPEQPVLYFNYCGRAGGLRTYDMRSGQPIRAGKTDPRIDRMAFWARPNELLLTSLLNSRVTRFDADTLQAKGHIPSAFGIRVLAIDDRRDLLVGGSLFTGKLIFVNLRANRLVDSFFVGPWIRTIRLDQDRGIAYVSSNGGLYRVNYGTRH